MPLETIKNYSSISTVNASFSSLFLSGIERLLSIVDAIFPELGIVREDCVEMSWIQSMVYIAADLPIDTSPQALTNRSSPFKGYFKVKSNYVQAPIPVSGIEGMWRRMFEPEGERSHIQMVPYGGRMAEISDSAIPFPHRGGNLYETLMMVYWHGDEDRDSDKYLTWIRNLDSYLSCYVTGGAYVNIRDLDLGVNEEGVRDTPDNVEHAIEPGDDVEEVRSESTLSGAEENVDSAWEESGNEEAEISSTEGRKLRPREQLRPPNRLRDFVAE